MDRSTVDSLSENDVLCGRGNGVQNYKGNVNFRILISSWKEKYSRAAKHEKNPMCQSIYEIIRSRNPPGRFLQKEKSSWVEISKKKALEKIGQRLREKSREKRTQKTYANVLL